MTNFDQAAFTPVDLPGFLRLVSAIARARWPASACLMTNDVAWQLPGSAPEENIRLWRDAGGLVGYAWFQPPTDLFFDVRPDLPVDHPVLAGMLRWGERRRRAFGAGRPPFVDVGSMAEWEQELRDPRPTGPDDGVVLRTFAFERDEGRVAFLEANGFAAARHHGLHLRRSLDAPIPESDLPDGWRLRHVGQRDFAERVATHRDAWSPGSAFTLETYLSIRAMELYDPELDLVLEAPDGTFASYCLAWADRTLGVGSFEPVGTRPAWRRMGAARHVTHEGLRRLKAKGMHGAIVRTAGFNAPAANLYRSCGFAPVDVLRTFVKTLR